MSEWYRDNYGTELTDAVQEESRKLAVASSRYFSPHMAARRIANRLGLRWEKVELLASSLQTDQEPLVLTLEHGSVDAIMRNWDQARTALRRCQSPIEEVFLVSLVCMSDVIFDWDVGGHSQVGHWKAEGATLFQQFPEGRYRIDFVVSGSQRIAIELDGHEFHERTKQQAQRDKSRDRDLTAAGWQVLRFTGSEVWNNPDACADEALRIAFGRASG